MNSGAITAKITIFAEMKSISILIPVFNWDCSLLLTDLHRQGCRLGVPFEILVADDCSTARFRNVETAAGLEHCRYIGLEENVGRAAIRNMLAMESQYDELLFLDCDGRVRSECFLADYMAAADLAQVVCGGVIHPDSMPAPGVELRYRYERKADEKRSAAYRSLNPYARFTPFSFMISRELFLEIKFDESFREYGYEDVLFGLELERRQATVLHIDNPMEHLGLESNEVYLKKTGQAVRNASDHMDTIGSGSELLKHFSRLEKCGMLWVPRLVWRLFHEPMKRNLLGNKPSLKVFSLYKLCYLCSIRK